MASPNPPPHGIPRKSVGSIRATPSQNVDPPNLPNPEIDVSSPPASESLGFDFGDLNLNLNNPNGFAPQKQPPPPPPHQDAPAPSSPRTANVRIIHSSEGSSPPSYQSPAPGESSPVELESGPHSRAPSRDLETPEPERIRHPSGSIPVTRNVVGRQLPVTHSAAYNTYNPHTAVVSSGGSRGNSPQTHSPNHSYDGTRHSSQDSTAGADTEALAEPPAVYAPLHYHHNPPPVRHEAPGHSRGTTRSNLSDSPASSIAGDHGIAPGRYLSPLGGSGHGASPVNRPMSSYSNLSLDHARGRENSPQGSGRDLSRSGRSPDSRPISYVDLLNAPYPQAAPTASNFNNAHLQTAVGNNASLLSNRKTLEMYRANAKKTNEPSVQYEFALFMISAAEEAGQSEENGPGRRDLESPYVDNTTPGNSRADMLKEARHILQRLSDRSYPFAQYYLADGYASGLFSKGKQDYDKAFPLFVSASKHGHAEAGYRAALCYEFGWGCRKDPAKSVPFYRHSASKNHPGAMMRLGRACLVGDLGLGKRNREGLKWLKRATESADRQYNRAPYELGLLYETGYGEDVFQDEGYAAQLFTQAAELGHAEASYRLGDAYEHGKLSCPQDPALSVHFYNGAAQQGHAGAMMALCAWYIVGADPVLSKDDNEAYQWAKQAAELGLAKAEYAVGYFTEMGIGCRRDPLEANMWYVRAADQGDERATYRLSSIRAAASGEDPHTASMTNSGKGRKGSSGPSGAGSTNGGGSGAGAAAGGGGKDDKDCIIM
ncbi:MAG: hypothetical protein M4579_004387 [Chaenotheca gracillima]|nr:MAG: hypothetical protein M4579_004387 [Chaenotheca gracillima]